MLSDEDRERIRAEEEYRARIRREIEQPPPIHMSRHMAPPAQATAKAGAKPACLTCLAVVVIAVLLFFGFMSSLPTTTSTEPLSTRRGMPGTITNVDGPAACFPTEAGLGEFTKWAARGDREESARALITYRGQMLDNGHAVKVLDIGVLVSRIRVTDKGVECFISSALLRK